MINQLELPISYLNIEEKEMEYIDGGYYLSNDDVKALLMSVGVAGVSAASIPLITAGIYTISGTIAATIPGLGWVTGGLLAANATSFAWACVNAVIKGTGVEIGIGLPTGLSFSYK